MTSRELIDRQAEDPGLWFIAKTAPEAYLQCALRELHALVESEMATTALSSSMPICFKKNAR